MEVSWLKYDIAPAVGVAAAVLLVYWRALPLAVPGKKRMVMPFLVAYGWLLHSCE